MDIAPQIEQKFYIRISTKWRGPLVTNYKNNLLQNGFTFNERKNYSSFFELLCPESDLSFWKEYAAKRNLKIVFFPEKYARDNTYRKTFFDNHKPISEPKYRCAYCGRMITYKQTTVDHIFPVNKMCYDERTRNQAKMFGITETNQEKNLVACCKHCNSKKGTKTGLWIILGFLGKSNYFWMFRQRMRMAFLIIIIATALVFLFKPTIQMPFSSEQIQLLQGF